MISHVSRTLVSVSVCSARPNFAGLPTAISFFASGPRTGVCTAPSPTTSTRSASAGARICALKDPGASASSSSLASRSRAVRPMNTPPARTLNSSDCTAGHRAPLPGRGMVFGTSEVPSPDGGEGEDGVAAGVVPVGEGACRRVSGANTRQRPGRLLLECLDKRQPRVQYPGACRTSRALPGARQSGPGGSRACGPLGVTRAFESSDDPAGTGHAAAVAGHLIQDLDVLVGHHGSMTSPREAGSVVAVRASPAARQLARSGAVCVSPVPDGMDLYRRACPR